MTAEPLVSASVTSVPLTEIVPIAISAPSGAEISKRAAAGRRAAAASSASSNTIVSESPVAATLAEAGSGPAMSPVVACATSEARLLPSPLIANTR